MYKIFLLAFIFFLMLSCNNTLEKTDNEQAPSSKEVVLTAPEWSKNANIYEVNIRQYTPEGTFNAFDAHLPRIKEMGVDILWLMPIFPVGEEGRKGGMGSPYSVKDYKGVNPDFGTKEDFQNLVNHAHELGFKLILDWVANHSAFDNVWIKDHPAWYTQDSTGRIIHPADTDWTDVADLNYDNKEMRLAMIDALQYWVKTFDIDGYRCDVAGFVPDDFWKEAILALQQTKHLFMLGEWDEAKMHDDGFHMTYGWGFHHIMNQVAKGEEPIAKIDSFLLDDATKYKKADYRMNFTTNHDENSWNGTVYERMGIYADAMTVLAFTAQGMPLIYGGQEASLNKRLSFFEKDSIDWSDLSKAVFFKKLLALKHKNEALWNGAYGGDYKRMTTTKNDAIFAYSRVKNDHVVIVTLNLSKENQTFELTDYPGGIFTNTFTGEKQRFAIEDAPPLTFTLEAGAYIVLEK